MPNANTGTGSWGIKEKQNSGDHVKCVGLELKSEGHGASTLVTLELTSTQSMEHGDGTAGGWDGYGYTGRLTSIVDGQGWVTHVLAIWLPKQMGRFG